MARYEIEGFYEETIDDTKYMLNVIRHTNDKRDVLNAGAQGAGIGTQHKLILLHTPEQFKVLAEFVEKSYKDFTDKFGEK